MSSSTLFNRLQQVMARAAQDRNLFTRVEAFGTKLEEAGILSGGRHGTLVVKDHDSHRWTPELERELQLLEREVGLR